MQKEGTKTSCSPLTATYAFLCVHVCVCVHACHYREHK